MPAGKGAQVGGGDGRDAGDLAGDGMAVGMTAEKVARESAAGDPRRLDLILLQRLDNLGAHPRQGIRLEARLGQRHLQQAHRFRNMLLQGGDRR